MKKTLCIMLTVVLSLGAFSFVGCKKQDEDSIFRIEVSNAGFGKTWLDPLIEIFESEHPGITVKKTDVIKQDNQMVEKIMSGTTEIDLFFPETDMVLTRATQKLTVGGVTYDSPFVELSDILDAKLPGENRTMGDKMNDQYYDRQKTVLSDGSIKHYTVPWMQAPIGIVLNKNLYNENVHGKLPNTTNELFDFCDSLQSMGIVPFIHAMDTTYWDHVYLGWMYQYNGSENMKKWWEGYTISGSAAGQRYSPLMFSDQGLLEALKVLKQLVTGRNGKSYMHPYSNTNNFTQVQNYFLEPNKNKGEAEVMMMPNGAWLAREMEENYAADEVNVEFIRMPIVSALGTKLGITDRELSAIVDWIDDGAQVGSEPTFTSTNGTAKADVLDAVIDARRVNPAFDSYNACIPAYSNHVDLAKEFLQLIATDRGIEAMLRKCGSMAGYEYDIANSPVKDELSDFMYSVNVLAQEGFCFSHRNDLFTYGGVYPINTGSSPTFTFATTDTTAEAFFKSNYDYTSENWSAYMSLAGLA